MADVPILYTGRGFAPNIPKDDGRAISRLSDFIVSAEKLKYDTFKQNEQEFLKNSAIDPVFFISTKNQETQAKALDMYNKRWAEKMKVANNNLSTEDKMAMLSEKNYLIAQQQKMQSEQDLWQQHRSMVMQNPNKYDIEEWSEYDNNYRISGDYPLIAPPIKAKSLDMALEDNPIVGNEVRGEPEYIDVSGIKMFSDVTYSGTEQQARQRVKDVAMLDEAYTKDLVKQFSSLDEATKLQYLDADKNGTITPEERKDFNPILKWAQDTKWQKALKKATTKPTQIRTQATNKYRYNLNIGGQTISMNPGKEHIGSIIYGTPRTMLIDFGGQRFGNIPTDGASKFIQGSTVPIPLAAGGNIAGYLKHYDRDKDVFIFEVTKDYDSPYVEGGRTIEIPASKLGGDYDTLPVVIGDKETTIGAIRGTSQNVTSKTKKKRFNPVTGTFEEE